MVVESGYSINEDLNDCLYEVVGDDWSADQVGEETGNFFHGLFYAAKYNDNWDHYLNVWIHSQTLNMYVLHQLWSNNADLGPRYLDALKLYEDSLYNCGSIEKTIAVLKKLKNELVVGYIPDNDRTTLNN